MDSAVYVHVYIKFTVLLLTMLRISFVVYFVPFSFHKHMQWLMIWRSSWPIPQLLKTAVRDSFIGIILKLMDISGSNFSTERSIAEFSEANQVRKATCMKKRTSIVNISEVSWTGQLMHILVMEQMQSCCEWRDWALCTSLHFCPLQRLLPTS